MVNYKEFYINNKPKPGKTRCCEEELNNSIDCNGILPQQLGEYLKIKNHLSEYNTKADRELVLANLGIDDSINEYLKNKIGYIYEDIEHGRFLAFENEDTKNQYLETGDESLILTQWHNELQRGLPIYTKSLADRLTDIDPERYIVIPDETDITSAPTVLDKTYNTSINGPLANILFSAIRLLLAEIAKIKNTFNYGIHSYSGTNTAMSRIEGLYTEEDEEPLWAIDESELSLITEIPISGNTTLFPKNDSSQVVIGANLTLHIIGNAIWNDTTSILLIDDSKLLVYITSSGNGIKINLLSNFGTLLLNLSELTQLSFENYNYLIIIGRKVENNGLYLGNNYIWISVTNPINNQVLTLGYYDNGILRKEISYIDNIYTINSIEFENLLLNRCVIYSKYTDFSSEVILSLPEDTDYSYKAAHITIRSVKSYNVLDSIKDLLPENELIFVEDTKRLFIKNNYRLVPIAGNGQQIEDEGMTREETIELLEQYGIIKNDDGEISIQDLSDIIFIHQGSGLKYKIEIDSEGNFHSTLIKDLEEDYSSKLAELNLGNAIRGFVSRMNSLSNPYDSTKDLILNSDRIKIGSFYAPDKTNKVFGCSHCFVELENTSDKDFLLDGCYLHFLRKNTIGEYEVLHLPLKGIVPKLGTFLIRGAKKAEFDDPNTFIKVRTFDLEWWIEEGNNNILLDFSHNGEIVEDTTSGKTSIYGNDPHGFAITFGNDFEGNPLKYDTVLVTDNSDKNTKGKAPKLYSKYFIDAVYYNSTFNKNKTAYWTSYSNPMFYIKNKKFLDCIYKNTFELDPAKQAYQALNTYDSSRIRNEKKSDFQYLYLNKEYIEFTKSDDKYPVSKFTPKASFENKNVCTDKTQLDIEKPNAVTVSFGINPYTTRCFNWVSGGLFDEYVFIKLGNSWKKIESYKDGDHTKSQDPNEEYPKRKEFNNSSVINNVYKRIVGRFPASNTQYTSHKCIIDIVSEAVQSPTEYSYIVGRADKNGNPDLEHCSEEYTFTLYPTSYIPRIYLITDQQGFHWVEYLAWAAAAKIVNELIENEVDLENIIPILVNTGDMTLSGARVNEWLDYYNAGKCLFNHLELMNIVGNNDLCNIDETILGTGDDPGKSNPYYFHVFYCYEISPIYKDNDLNLENPIYPIINNVYIPSIYKIEFNKFLLLFVNSELTETYCKYKLNLLSDSKVVNAYTGYTIDLTNAEYIANNLNFTPIYDILYKMTDLSQKELIAFCHEMPFTVITHENVATDYKNRYRSINENSNLIGSHLNLISNSDGKGLHWFSRLLEYRNCKLCIGGHKHTYAITYPLLENYKYTKEYNISTHEYDNVNKTSLTDGPMNMGPTLENDYVNWEQEINGDTFNTSKFPLIKKLNNEDPTGITWRTQTIFNPSYYVNSFVGEHKGIVYFMCQATGFKLMSNKELPTPYQTFSQFLPESSGEKDDQGYVTSISSASESLRSPMYAIFKFNNSLDEIEAFLIKLPYILKAPSTVFTQLDYYTEKKPNERSYLIPTPSEDLTNPDVWNYGVWNDGLELRIIKIEL